MSVIVEEKSRKNKGLSAPPAHTMEEYRPQQSKQPEQTRPHLEAGNGSPGIPPSVHERANPPPEGRAYPTLPQKSALNRTVERTRDLYERNEWVFLPFSEAGEISPMLPSRSPTLVFSAPSLDNLLEEPKSGDKTQSPQDARKDSAKVPHLHNETKRQLPNPIARSMREAAQREGVDPQVLIQEVTLKLQQMLADHDPREADELQRLFDIPPDPSSPSPDELQSLFDLPSTEEPTSDDKR
jgi:hypothetical protein